MVRRKPLIKKTVVLNDDSKLPLKPKENQKNFTEEDEDLVSKFMPSETDCFMFGPNQESLT